MESLEEALLAARACRLCESSLPLPPRPVLRAATSARIVLIGQAPGLRVHETGIPWNDASGDRLREWLEMDRQLFYDETKIAIIPMGFCYPGKGKSGDLPPRPECAPHWHPRLRAALPQVRLALLIGSYAQAYYLKGSRSNSLTETVKNFKQFLPDYFPLVHPSPRNKLWLKKNPWFEREILPALRKKVRAALAA
ncbi:MAG: uracil-DNA glycosylase family protein [Leptospirales bacterium]|nr:uracil-DNA glycosylase family protein [Leptospirales bacterium]